MHHISAASRFARIEHPGGGPPPGPVPPQALLEAWSAAHRDAPDLVPSHPGFAPHPSAIVERPGRGEPLRWGPFRAVRSHLIDVGFHGPYAAPEWFDAGRWRRAFDGLALPWPGAPPPGIRVRAGEFDLATGYAPNRAVGRIESFVLPTAELAGPGGAPGLLLRAGLLGFLVQEMDGPGGSLLFMYLGWPEEDSPRGGLPGLMADLWNAVFSGPAPALGRHLTNRPL